MLLQKSNKRDLNLTVNMAPSSVVKNKLQLHHNARDYDETIRAYIDTILGKNLLFSNNCLTFPQIISMIVLL